MAFTHVYSVKKDKIKDLIFINVKIVYIKWSHIKLYILDVIIIQ